ncbi:hypothetical protein OEZ86_009607 [Tetradesmus obliquus]|uniref:Uncharacterized protein n=1 Tax=Tetradesmus obliquus TaxID=3088 RepID=A0ABY8UPN4_TETOB|nr:hypothetical protein OEZ85_001051 [Tetradesmus obliquus]WIA43082.1 hypothetical protein OEZ86_009607 [Tetradesmus obliquus]
MPSALAGLFGGDQHQRFADITRTSCELLTPTFEEVQLLPAERLAAATAAERTLNRHLRLWHPPTWGETLQQVLQSRHGMQRVMAVRSLMGPPSLEAARTLVEKKGLFMRELLLPAAELPPAAGNAAGANDAAGQAEIVHVLVISCMPMELAEALQRLALPSTFSDVLLA